jgi:acetylornithine deacetylase/succinyl-diaminopimelate desuccinylase-like protein
MTKLEHALNEADGGLKASLGRLFELLRYPSIGTDPAYNGDCRACAEWVAKELEGLGFETRIRSTTGQPVVVGKYANPGLPPHAPHILFYGHYDVQPPDPLDLWQSPPFEPEMRKNARGNDAIYARGAHDDKGQFMTFLEASRAWLKVHGALPFRLTVLIEGDEEGDSSHLERFLAANAREFACDIAFVCDTARWDAETPGITTRLRGCIMEEVTVAGPKIDLHSGYYGGAARNPIRVLTKILGDMHDANGRIAIPGFYGDVEKVSPKQRAQWAKLEFSGKSFLKSVGLSIPAGEAGFTALEQIWIRPTAEINGIYGGYQGAGSKTVLPSAATAKISFRTVRFQSPAKIRKAFRAFVKARLPEDCRASFESGGGDSTGIALDEANPFLKAASAALKDEWKKAPVLMGTGGSIPVVAAFSEFLGIDSLLVGFAMDDDAAHSPNEKYDLASFHKGIRSWVRIIAACAG